jgi:flagellar biosynthesis GTPase FlhF
MQGEELKLSKRNKKKKKKKEKKSEEERRIKELEAKEKEEELQRIEKDNKEKEEQFIKKKEEDLAIIEPRPLVEHEEITSSISISEVEEVISNQLTVETDPLIVPTVPPVEETKEETTTPDISTVSFLFLCNSLNSNQVYYYSYCCVFCSLTTKSLNQHLKMLVKPLP